ncbi:MAG: hypothetical protein DDG58_11165 [Ardenticatenia bacterium]|nr:MAG: hypothetical protein DDG58_11165 [Ardenticatenia bacterium]
MATELAAATDLKELAIECLHTRGIEWVSSQWSGPLSLPPKRRGPEHPAIDQALHAIPDENGAELSFQSFSADLSNWVNRHNGTLS